MNRHIQQAFTMKETSMTNQTYSSVLAAVQGAMNVESSMGGRQIAIAGTEVQIVEFRGERVVTFAMIDKVHQRVEGTAKRAFNENQTRFVAGEDFVDLTSDEIRTMSDAGVFPPRTARGKLITRRGYLKLVKILNDDRAWAVLDDMIDRYFAVEARQAVDPMAALNDPATMRGLLLGYSEKVLALQVENRQLGVKAAAHDRIAEARGSLCVTDAAKALQMKRDDLFRWLHANGWIYRRLGTRNWLGYESKRKTGYLEHKVETVPDGQGGEKIAEHVRITPKGLAKLAEIFGVDTAQGSVH